MEFVFPTFYVPCKKENIVAQLRKYFDCNEEFLGRILDGILDKRFHGARGFPAVLKAGYFHCEEKG